MTEEQAREVQEDDRSIKKMEDFTSPDELYQELVKSVKKYHPSTDLTMIEKHIRWRRLPIKIRFVNPENLISFIRFALVLFWQIWSLIRRVSQQAFSMMWWRILP